MGPMDSPQTDSYWSLWPDCFHASLKMERQATWQVVTVLITIMCVKQICFLFCDHGFGVALLQQNQHTTTMYALCCY